MAASKQPVDWGRLRALADAQAGLLTRAQVLAAGGSTRLIEHRVRSRRWTTVERGVYRTGDGDPWWQRATAAFLRTQSANAVADAAWRGRTAAFAWGLVRTPPLTVELAVPLQRKVTKSRDVDVRRLTRWDRVIDDRAYPWRTALVPTILDVAAAGALDEALAICAEAVRRELTTAGAIATELRVRARHPHRLVLEDALDDIEAGAQSAAEVRYIRDVERAHGLPEAERQGPSDEGKRRFHDNRYRAFGSIVEVDGRVGHGSWADRIRDGARDRQLLGVGEVTTRVYWPDVAVTPCATAGEIAAILQSRGWTGRPHRCTRPGCSIR